MEQGRKRFTVRQLGMQNGKFFYLLFTSKLLTSNRFQNLQKTRIFGK